MSDKENLRPCLIDNGKTSAWFHCWNHWSHVLEPSILVGGHPGGVVAGTYAIVELDDGSIQQCHPTDIRFVDVDREEEEE